MSSSGPNALSSQSMWRLISHGMAGKLRQRILGEGHHNLAHAHKKKTKMALKCTILFSSFPFFFFSTREIK